MNTKNKTIIGAVVGVVVLAGAFYGGVVYGKSQPRTFGTNAGGRAGQGGNAAAGMFAARGSGIQGGVQRGMNGGMIAGEIISKDEKSITVKLQNGGSKIVFVSPTLAVSKTVPGTISDITIGKNVIIQGKTNSDGSVTASSVQIRPEAMTSPSGSPVNQ